MTAFPESILLETTRKSARLSSIIRHGFYVRTEINQHFPVSSVSSIRRPQFIERWDSIGRIALLIV